MRIYLYTLFLSFFVLGCTNYEKIGNYKYRVKVSKVNTGEYQGMKIYIKSFYLNNEFQAGCVLKSQKMDFEQPSDTLFSKGILQVDGTSKKIICKEYYFFGYRDFLQKDSSLSIFEQQTDGKLKLIYKGDTWE